MKRKGGNDSQNTTKGLTRQKVEVKKGNKTSRAKTMTDDNFSKSGTKKMTDFFAKSVRPQPNHNSTHDDTTSQKAASKTKPPPNAELKPAFVDAYESTVQHSQPTKQKPTTSVKKEHKTSLTDYFPKSTRPQPNDDASTHDDTILPPPNAELKPAFVCNLPKDPPPNAELKPAFVVADASSSETNTSHNKIYKVTWNNKKYDIPMPYKNSKEECLAIVPDKLKGSDTCISEEEKRFLAEVVKEVTRSFWRLCSLDC